jgi:diguanylate cyclase (GGDEF)-like protein
MFLDLDKFKQVNDALGHDTGDQLLKGVAVRLKACLRETDHLFRLGGDEFTIILTNLGQDIDVARVARKILDALKPVRFASTSTRFLPLPASASVYFQTTGGKWKAW